MTLLLRLGAPSLRCSRIPLRPNTLRIPLRPPRRTFTSISISKRPTRTLLYTTSALALLSTGTYISTLHAEQPPQNGDHPLQEDLLNASDAERRLRRRHRRVNARPAKRVVRTIRDFVNDYVIEPIACTIRFLRLALIFGPVLLSTPLIFLGERVPEKDNERGGTLLWFEILVAAMERAGPTFIKLGQWAASRSDIFPSVLCEMMSRLHSNAPAHSLEETKAIIESSFDPLRFEDIFESFSPEPLGTGAIAQVYKGKLRPDLTPPEFDDEELNFRRELGKAVGRLVRRGPEKVPSTEVAIKVLHPRVDKIIHRDLAIMGFFAWAIDLIPTMEWLDLPNEVQKFGEMMRLQLDLRIEANNLSTFRSKFLDRSTVTFPAPYTEFSTRQVLIEEFAHGIPLDAILENGGGSFQAELADMGLDAFLHMLLIDNFIHADLHPGNIMLRFIRPPDILPPIPPLFGGPRPSHHHSEDINTQVAQVLARLMPLRKDKAAWNAELTKLDQEGYRPQFIFIDTGLVTELNDVNRVNFIDLFRAIAEFDGLKAGQLMVERCKTPELVLDPDIFALKMQNLILGIKSNTFALGQVKIGDFLSETLGMVRKHHVRLEGDFVNVIISILLLEGIGRSLDPDLDLFKTALPMLRTLQKEKGKSLAAGGALPDRNTGIMFLVWLVLEARAFVHIRPQQIEDCIKYDLMAPNI